LNSGKVKRGIHILIMNLKAIIQDTDSVKRSENT
jgi:hypothetical protein